MDELLKHRGAGLHGRRLLLGQRLSVAELGGPFERRDGPEVPDALQIRTPVAQSRWLPDLRLTLSYGWQRREHGDDGGNQQ